MISIICRRMKVVATIISLLSSTVVFAQSDLEEEIRQHFLHGRSFGKLPEKMVEKWGEGCVPILIQMLQENSGLSDKITSYLGKTKSPLAVRAGFKNEVQHR